MILLALLFAHEPVPQRHQYLTPDTGQSRRRYTGVGTCERSVEIQEAEQRKRPKSAEQNEEPDENQRMGPVRGYTGRNLIQVGKVNGSARWDC